MKYLFVLFMMFGFVGVNFAQTSTTTTQTTNSKVKQSEKTVKTFTIKGKTYIVYQGSRGGFYIWRYSKSGNWYKYYVTKKIKK